MYQQHFFDIQHKRPWHSAHFRSHNGICGIFLAFYEDGGQVPPHIDVFSIFRDIVSEYRPYVVHNHQIQMYLTRMVINVESSSVFIKILKATLMDTLVPFCIFIHRHLCEHDVETVRTRLLDIVFVEDRSIVYKQWPSWNDAQQVKTTEYTCPITLEPIVYSAIASDGHMYERAAILKQMVSKCISPLTREPLDYELVSYNGPH